MPPKRSSSTSLPVARERERLDHDVGAVVADRARAQLDAVADDVVLVGQHVERILALERLEPALRHRERVVREGDRPGLLVPLVHREVDDPGEAVAAPGDEPELLRDPLAREPGELRHGRGPACDEEHGIARLQALAAGARGTARPPRAAGHPAGARGRTRGAPRCARGRGSSRSARHRRPRPPARRRSPAPAAPRPAPSRSSDRRTRGCRRPAPGSPTPAPSRRPRAAARRP